ncbi:PREDICTED: FK506-binding protein 15 [Acromyrmex echinatior]|uniref:FK506-binding protein 15 n=1 Tax=Acromyrmex echinatior TaxID=103372 RepID=F4WC98_ACREC|nr:PREDICTED: FK506-binding protein 15 [Acromyrmex echinatior]EGI68078.1 FK506-binding protein 15 [Acromyrmex echinatior]
MSAQNQLPNLDKIFRDDDEPDFVPSGGSNLAAIFGQQPKLEPHSVKQVPKKNTRYNIQQTAPSSKTEVLIAKAVHAFKLQNGQYACIGKVGMALTGNVATRVYQIILYKTKQEYISVATVTRDFVYTVQTNNYASYYDNNKENWSILFEKYEHYLEFAIEVGLARYFALQEKGENVIYQDLMPSDKDVIAKEGDNICIKYFVGSEIIQPFKTNFAMSQTMTVEISTDENWERILLGSGKGLKRVLFLPPSKQISLGPGFPKERDIMLIIEITDIRVQEENSPTSKNLTSGKAAIISRMAKMGQSILPKMPLPSTTDSEDTEDDLPHKSPRHKKIEQSEGNLQKNLSFASSDEKEATQKAVEPKTGVPSVDSSTYKPLISAQPLTPQWTPSYFAGHYVTMDNQMYPVSQTVNRAIPAALDPGMNMLLSETRIANAEIRMGISKISDNVQKLLDKFHALELQNATTPTNDKATLDASWKMLLALNASQTGIKVEELSKNIDKDMSDEKIREAQSKISSLENDLKRSKEEKESLLQINENLSKKLQELETRLSDTNDELKKTKEALEVTKNTIAQCKEENINLEDRLSKCHREHVLQADTISCKQKDIEKKNKEIKQIMNKTYHTLSEKLADESRSELSFDYVKSTIANTIKHITLQVLYEDPDEEDRESKAIKDVNPTSIKTISHQQIEEPNEKHIEKSVLNPNSDNDFSIKCMETSRSTTIMPIFENEPPPVPLEGIDEVDSE